MKESDRAAVRDYERHIQTIEGPYHVEGRYYANVFDAERQRHFAAVRMVMESQRRAASDPTAITAPRARVGTWLVPRERARVDVATGAQLDLTHRETLPAIRGDLTTGRIDAALVSAALVRLADVPTLSAIVRDFPANPVVGFVAEADEPQALAGALAFGQAGVAALVDARTPAGWSTLRSAFDGRRLADPFVQRAVRELTSTGEGQVCEAACTAGWCPSSRRQYEYMERAKERMKLVIPATLAIIFLLLYFNFRSVGETMIVMLSLPFALVGGIWFIWLLGYNWSVTVAIGFIALAGVAAETGVVMLIYLDHAWNAAVAARQGSGLKVTLRDLYDAVMEGAVERVRPKMMTVTAIMAGLLPILWGGEAGADVMKRIAARWSVGWSRARCSHWW